MGPLDIEPANNKGMPELSSTIVQHINTLDMRKGSRYSCVFQYGTWTMSEWVRKQKGNLIPISDVGRSAMDALDLGRYIKKTPLQMDVSSTLNNGVDFYSTIFGPDLKGQYSCTVSIGSSGTCAGDSQSYLIGRFSSPEEAAGKARRVAGMVQAADPEEIFG